MSGSGERDFKRDERGAVLIEALIAFPVLTILSFGLLEFGNLMWQRQQMQAGVRDAARYWSRCRPVSVNYASTCNETTASNIAFYGNPAGTGPLRVTGWDDASEITITPAKSGLWAYPTADDIVKVTGEVEYSGSPVFSAILPHPLTISASTEMRAIGW